MQLTHAMRAGRALALGILLLAATACSATAGGSGGGGAAGGPGTLRIGYQKYGLANLLRVRGASGLRSTWSEFPSGPALTEALNAGAIDVGEVGEAPPVFAAAAGVPLRIIGVTSPAPAAEAVLVHHGSPLRSIADLKGRKVALNKGSNVHYLLLKLLRTAGLDLADVQVIYLPPAEGRAAFEARSVDAWVIWDPYLAIAQAETGARVLADGRGVVANRSYFVASEQAVREKPEALRAFLARVSETARWAGGRRQEASALLARALGTDRRKLDAASARLASELAPLDGTVARESQQIADAFTEQGLIPGRVEMGPRFERSLAGEVAR